MFTALVTTWEAARPGQLEVQDANTTRCKGLPNSTVLPKQNPPPQGEHATGLFDSIC
jgi:hypothetical protein